MPTPKNTKHSDELKGRTIDVKAFGKLLDNYAHDHRIDSATIARIANLPEAFNAEKRVDKIRAGNASPANDSKDIRMIAEAYGLTIPTLTAIAPKKGPFNKKRTLAASLAAPPKPRTNSP
jgi:hypothetical protein